MPRDFSAGQLAHIWMNRFVKPGDFCIDATAGRGRDTAYLCELVGDSGRVLALDIQPDAIESTRALLTEKNLSDRAELVLDGHENMARYADKGSVSCVTFNFGWLPGGDHGIFTRAESSIKAVSAALELIKPGGAVTLCIYYGRENGVEERDALLDYLRTVDSFRYTVMVCQFQNRVNDPPIPVLITRDN